MNEVLLYSEINIACIGVLLILLLKVHNSMFLQSQRFFFRIVAVCSIAFFVFDAMWILFTEDVLTAPWLVQSSMVCLYFVFSVLTGYFWFLFSEDAQGADYRQNRLKAFAASIPALIMIALSIASLKTGWLFVIDANDVYHRGPLYLLQVAVGGGYIVVTAAKALYLSTKTKVYQQKQRYRALASFVVLPTIALCIQVATPEAPVLCIGTTLAMLSVYIDLQEQMISLDPLTKLNNRNQLRQYMSGRLGRYGGKKPLYLLIMDGNRFKQINDRYGHIEGDHALCEIADALRRACVGPHDFISRFGGDEFIVLAEPENGDTVEALCERIHHELAQADTPYPLSVCIGYAKYTTDVKNGQHFINLADEELYKAKQARP